MMKRCSLACDTFSQMAKSRSTGHPWDDPDMEIGSWPDFIDQRRLTSLDWREEDDEDDDPEVGVEDAAHDVFDEDGI